MDATSATAARPSHLAPMLVEAEALWYAAEYRRCLAVLEAAPPCAQRFLLAARAQYRLRDYAAALAALEAGEAFFTQLTVRAQADALGALVHQILGHARESEALAERVGRAYPESTLMEPQTALTLAFCAWLRDDLTACNHFLRSADAALDSTTRGLAISIRAWVAASRGQFQEHVTLLAEALRLMLAAPLRDIGLIANTLQALADRCREMYAPEAALLAAATARDLPWTEATRVHEHETTRYLAWSHALSGDYISGLRQLLRARNIAPSPVRAFISRLDHAFVAFISGERMSAQAQLLEAYDSMQEIEWQRMTGPEIVALPLAAELFARVDPTISRTLLQQFDALKDRMSLAFGLRHDGTLHAFADFARAVTMCAENETAPARKYAIRAFTTFDRLGYDWRAARCALLLYRSGAGEQWLALAKKKAAKYPRSFIAVELAQIESQTKSEPMASLTPRQREILQLLNTGDSIDDVAATLRCSRNTIRVHITKIHRALKVTNRVQLLRKAGLKQDNPS